MSFGYDVRIKKKTIKNKISWILQTWTYCVGVTFAPILELQSGLSINWQFYAEFLHRQTNADLDGGSLSYQCTAITSWLYGCVYLNTGGYVLPALHSPIPLKRGKFKFFGDGAEENTQSNTARTVCRQQSVGCSFTYETDRQGISISLKLVVKHITGVIIGHSVTFRWDEGITYTQVAQ
jgi:hypothetical protein